MDSLSPPPEFAALQQRLDGLSAQVGALLEHQRKQQELLDELVLPMAKEMMTAATGKFEQLDKAGYFAFGRELLQVGNRIATGYSPQEVRQLGEAITGILDTVRAVTQPEVLTAAAEAAEVLQHADTANPIGLVGLVRATRDDDVQRGMAVMMEVLKKVGRGAAALQARQSRHENQREKLAAVLGPRRKLLGVERAAVPTRALPTPPPPTPAAPGATAAATRAPAPVVLDGVAFGADGHLADPSQWTGALAETIAASMGITLTEAHWVLIHFARADWASTKASPNIRRLTQGTKTATKDIYALFPKAPGRTIAKIAGIPKPAGCL